MVMIPALCPALSSRTARRCSQGRDGASWPPPAPLKGPALRRLHPAQVVEGDDRGVQTGTQKPARRPAHDAAHKRLVEAQYLTSTRARSVKSSIAKSKAQVTKVDDGPCLQKRVHSQDALDLKAIVHSACPGRKCRPFNEAADQGQ
jgi:hypothetical protein